MNINSLQFKEITKDLNITFKKVCVLELIKDNKGLLYRSPQLAYKNVNNYPYLDGIDEKTLFCKFKPNLPKIKGVYLWVIKDEIIYIGESVNLRKRFNSGYGNISPRNCFKYGQSTNVKMNRLVLNYYNKKEKVEIYIFPTPNHKELETALLERIKTKYNFRK